MDRSRLSLQKHLFVFLTILLLSEIGCAQEKARFDLVSVRAADLSTLAEKTRDGASPEGLNQIVYTRPSPDGKRVARAERVQAGLESFQYAIHINTIGTEETVRIAEVVNCFGLAWSPDGSKIAFSEGTIVHIADSDGQSRQVIYVGPGGPYPGASFDLKWSEDGQRVSFVQVENARNADLANPKTVTITLGVKEKK
jgi:Tol biopolymer transport system component